MRVEKVLAPNPSAWTGPGTNTWVIGDDAEVVVLDPGPVIPAHAEAIAARVGDRTVAAVVVTHTHLDHAPLANRLAGEWGTVSLGYGPSEEFRPDALLVEGSTVDVAGSSLEVVHTPGHADDHLCFVLDRWMFTGDHIMGGSTVMVQDLTAYLASLRKVRDRALDRLFPGHGPEIDDPVGVIDYYISHRLEREEQVIAALRSGAGSVGAIVEDVYADVDRELHPIAAHSVAAHVGKLVDDGVVAFDRTSDLWGSLVRLIR